MNFLSLRCVPIALIVAAFAHVRPASCQQLRGGARELGSESAPQTSNTPTAEPGNDAEVGAQLVGVGEGENCTTGVGPQHARLCSEGLVCLTDHPGSVGGSGTCVPKEQQQPADNDTEVWVGEGENCTTGVGPQHARLCSEGLVCLTDHPGSVGGSGTCVRQEGDEQPKKPLFVGENATCTRGVGPAHARLCDAGLVCHAEQPFRAGGTGICVRKEDDEQPTPVTVGEGEACTRGVGPRHARYCGVGLVCHTEQPDTHGGTGICTRREETEWPKAVVVVGKGKSCTRGVGAAHARLCDAGLVCHAEQPFRAGGAGICVHKEDDEQTTPVTVGEGEACTRGVGPRHARYCGVGLVCHTEQPHTHGGTGICTRREETEWPKAVVVVGKGKSCTRGVGAAHARLCEAGLVCHAEQPFRAGGTGICVRKEDDEQTTPVTVGEGEACTRGVGPRHARHCGAGLVCHTEQPHMRGGTGICMRREAGEHQRPEHGNGTDTEIIFP